MRNFFFFSFFIVTSFFETTYAKTQELRLGTGTVFITEVEGWNSAKDLFGIPFLYFSPETNGQRSNISFTDTGAELELNSKSIESSQSKYQASRKDWAAKVQAKPLEFIPYEVKTNKQGHKVHEIGFSYEHELKVYIEKSYYIECRGKIIFSKSLRLKINQAHEKVFADLIAGLDCAGV